MQLNCVELRHVLRQNKYKLERAWDGNDNGRGNIQLDSQENLNQVAAVENLLEVSLNFKLKVRNFVFFWDTLIGKGN